MVKNVKSTRLLLETTSFLPYFCWSIVGGDGEAWPPCSPPECATGLSCTCFLLHIFTARQRNVEGYVFISVCHSVQGGGWVPCDHYPWCIAPHCSVPPLPIHPRSPGLSPLGPPSPCTRDLDMWWPPLKHVRLASGQHASYWNALVFALCQGSSWPSSRVLYCCNFLLRCICTIHRDRCGVCGGLKVHRTSISMVQSHTKRKIIHCR